MQVVVKLGEQPRGGVLLEPQELPESGEEEKEEILKNFSTRFNNVSNRTHWSIRASVKVLLLCSRM